jgi:DNA-directed RNA polymerase specialized sigma24 family protein
VNGASHEVTTTGSSEHHGPAAFTTTHWSVVLEAQGESPAAQEALEKLCRTYWRPIFAFARRQGLRPDEAEDMTQGFFAELLERGSLSAVRKEKGRLRSFLLGGLKYFLANEGRRAMAIKRGKRQWLIPLDELHADDRMQIEAADPMTAEMIYERRWALTVLDRVLSRLKDEYLAADNAALFDLLIAAGRTGRAVSGRDRCTLGDDRECGPTGVLPISPTLPGVIARGNCSHGRDTRRYRRRAAPSHRGA